MNQDLLELLQVAHAAVDSARPMLQHGAPRSQTEKSDRDLVTNVDVAIERDIRQLLARKTPDIAFLGEEEGRSGSPAHDQSWVLDPIDGTSNFVHGLPFCGVSLGLCQAGEPVLGVIDLPFFPLRYSAGKGLGAFRGEEKIHASRRRDLSEAIVATGDFAVGANADERNQERFRLTERLAGSVQRVRMLGSAAADLAWVADGRLDASIMLSNNAWDTAAGVLIAREAGAHVVDIDGSPHNPESGATIACTPSLLSELLRLLTGAATPSPR